MKFLVMREAMIKGEGRIGNIRNSDHFPMVIETGCLSTSEEIVRMALDRISETYHSSYEYVVVPMTNAQIVSFKLKREYDVHIRDF